MASIKNLPHEERLRLFSAQARQYAIITLDPQGNIVDWPPGAENLMGWKEDEMVGKPGALIFTPEDRAKGAPELEMETARQWGESPDVRWHMRKDGSRFFVDGVLCAIRDEEDRVIGFGKILRDLTDHKQLSDYLWEQASLLDLSYDPAFSWELETDRVLYWNKGAEELYGYSAIDMVGKNPHVQLASTFPVDVKEALRRTGFWTGELVHTCKDGRQIHVESRMVLHKGLGFKPVVLESNRDITQRKEDESKLHDLADRLELANRRQGEFLATLAHELRNPLAPIRTGLDLMRISGNQPEVVGKTRVMMERQVDHLVHLVNDLLDLARINSGKIELHMGRVQLKDCILQAIEVSLPSIQAKYHDFKVDVPDQDIWIDADCHRLTQVISNLLTNAAKYTPEGGKVNLSVRHEKGLAEVVITDNGIGIPPQAQPYIFDMFTQVGEGLAHAQGGLGIGLNLVRRLTEKHGGTVSVESAGPGQGSTFTVRLPVKERVHARVAANTPDSTEPPTTNRLRILVADDNQDAANMLAHLLDALGHEVHTVPDGIQALEAAKRLLPDLALLDIGMPGMNGYELATEISKIPDLRNTTLAALTGWGAQEDREQSKAAGFKFHLTKPIDMKSLIDVITNVSEKKLHL